MQDCCDDEGKNLSETRRQAARLSGKCSVREKGGGGDTVSAPVIICNMCEGSVDADISVMIPSGHDEQRGKYTSISIITHP